MEPRIRPRYTASAPPASVASPASPPAPPPPPPAATAPSPVAPPSAPTTGATARSPYSPRPNPLSLNPTPEPGDEYFMLHPQIVDEPAPHTLDEPAIREQIKSLKTSLQASTDGKIRNELAEQIDRLNAELERREKEGPSVPV